MRKWEYKIINRPRAELTELQGVLNELGLQGYEVVNFVRDGADGIVILLKKEIDRYSGTLPLDRSPSG